MRFGSFGSIEARTRKCPSPETAGTVKNETRSRVLEPDGTAIVFGSFGLGAARGAGELRHEALLARDDRAVEPADLDVVARDRRGESVDAGSLVVARAAWSWDGFLPGPPLGAEKTRSTA